MKKNKETWEGTMAKLHEIFYKETGIEISLGINKALEKIEDFIRKEKEESRIKERNKIQKRIDKLFKGKQMYLVDEKDLIQPPQS